MGSEKFCLSWNDFESNISLSFRELREEKDFFDVTLSCGDEQIQAHKLILSACSPFFRSVLKKNVHQHPLLYLKGVKFCDLQAVLNFMYHGEVNVAQEELNSFLAVAEDLKVKGLTQNNQPTPQKTNAPAFTLPKPSPRPPPDRDPVPIPPQKRPPRPLAIPTNHDDEIQEVLPVKSEPKEPPPAPMTQEVYSQETLPTGSQEISPMDDSLAYQQEDSYEEYGGYEADQSYEGSGVETGLGQGQDPSKGKGVEITDGFWRFSSNGLESGDSEIQSPDDLKKYILREPVTRLNVCGICSNFKHKVITNVREHIESKHYSHMFTYECKFCQKTFNTKMGLAKHKPKCHESNKQGYYQMY
eukprot:GFUD01012277.1.p1 GENE.GFUD01012277.1~~GFUD01012277.1.p1  ORF type:complete len:357 (-),score=89.00 GFUD01012277.1:331-1401(-)